MKSLTLSPSMRAVVSRCDFSLRVYVVGVLPLVRLPSNTLRNRVNPLVLCATFEDLDTLTRGST
jgi:hypothetical protein